MPHFLQVLQKLPHNFFFNFANYRSNSGNIFLKIKNNKKYLRNSTGEERFHNLSLLAIKPTISTKMDKKDAVGGRAEHY